MQPKIDDSTQSLSVQEAVIAEMKKIAVQYEKKLAPLSLDTVLANSGLDSLCFAVLVVRLEERLGVDPFSSSESVGFPATLREFVRVYENATK
jgi:Phosphopantetheine attachment site